MKLNRDQFLETGYLIVRNAIPADKLEELRRSHEILVERQKCIWAREHQSGDPPGGLWETAPQPRLHLHNTPELIDECTISAVELWLHKTTHGVSSELMGTPDAAVTEMMMMCNPVRNHGPASWHRDLHPFNTAPLQGYIDDLLENGPRYVQWNIALYDDDVLWVVPGSHRRFNTAEEDRQLLADSRVPLSGGISVNLKAGDGVVYILPILHWGSNYSTKLRRTIHGGYANHTYYQDLSYTRYLSPPDQATFERWAQQSTRMQDITASVFRAAINQDAAAFREGLEKLQPGSGEKGKLLLMVFLSKAAYFLRIIKHPKRDGILPELRHSATRGHPTTLNWGPAFANRFSRVESEVLWKCFEPIDASLQAEEKHFAPGFQSGPMRYYFNEMTCDLDVETFLGSWNT